MKKDIYVLLIALGMTAQPMLTSCTLEREDFTEISESNFPKTENDLKLAVNALMYEFCTGYWNGEAIYGPDRNGYQTLSDMTSDCMWTCWGWEWDELRYHQFNNETSGNIPNALYNHFAHYQFLSKARNTIRRIEKSSVSQTVKTRYAGEAHALRGWIALYLYDLFGTVPVATDEQLDEPTTYNYIARLSQEQYDEMMETDLRTAINDLPETADRGRMTKGAAMMVLLKYYMIRGKANPEFWKKAETLARELYAMENRVYALQSDYDYVFSMDGLGNNEIILSVGCNSSASWTSNYMTAECLPSDMPWTANSSGWGGFVMPWDFYNTFEQGDKRTKCIVTQYTNTSGKLVTKDNSSQLSYGAIPLKYGKDPNMSGGQSGNDLIIYRYSDVLLTLAECIVRNGGAFAKGSEATRLVDRVRSRAGLTGLSDEACASEQAFLDALLLERGHEFYAEGLRRQDLIRFDKYIEYANNRIREAQQTTSGKDYKLLSNDAHNLFPIPQSFIDESKSAIKQNPGY